MYTLFPADHSRRNLGKHDSQLAPFSRDSIDFYPHLLINYDYQKDEEPIGNQHVPRNTHISETWKDGQSVALASERHVELMADSGGFQGASKGIDVDPIACMEWQNRNSDIAFIVDKIPVRHPKDGTTLLFNEIASQISRLTPEDPFFIECAQKTAENLDKAFSLKDEKVALYSIIQGNDYATKKKWLDIVSKDHDVDGFGIKGTSTEEIIASLILIEEQFPNKPVHFLGCGSFSSIAPLVYFSHVHKARVTSDASSHLQGTKSRLYLDPITHDKWRLLPDEKTPSMPFDVRGIKELPCGCNACRFANDNHIDRNSSMFGRVLTLHNLRMMRDMIEQLERIRHPDIFKGVARSLSTHGENIGSIINAIDLLNDSPDAARSRFVETHDIFSML